MLASQIAAIEALEKELGRSVEDVMREEEEEEKFVQAIEDAGHASATAEIEKSLGVTAGGEVHNDPAAVGIKPYLEQMRQNGIQPAEIVRETRLHLGDSLPDGILNEDETRLYKRLYGEPSRLGENDDVEEGVEEVEGDNGEESRPQLLDAEGEPVSYRLRDNESAGREDEVDESPSSTAPLPVGNIGVNALTKDASVHDIARSLGGRVVDEEEEEYYEEEEEDADEEDEYDGAVFRSHPLTRLGKFATSPRTVFPSEEGFVRPVENVMSKFSNKHLKEMCERTFGGEGLPDSPLTPKSGRARKQVSIPLEAGQNVMGEMEANAFLTVVMPPTYASILSVLSETRKRLGPTWLNNLLGKESGPRVLDASGGGAGIIAWREIVQAHWTTIHSPGRHPPPPPASKAVVLTGSDALRHRAAEMLENTTFVPRLPDYVHTRDIPTLEDDRPAQQRKQFDVIIAPHSLFPLKEEWQRKQHVQNLWSLLSPSGGVLILIEKGIPRGFEALAGARELLLERFIAIPEGHTTRYSNVAEDPLHKRQTGMIIAPCTNHERCPMYTNQGISRGRKDICSVQQRYIRPPFLQRVLGANDRNHDDVDFSYLSVMKGDDLRLRNISTWNDIADPLSAPLQQTNSPKIVDKEKFAKRTKVGFEDFTPYSMDSNEKQSAPYDPTSNPPAITDLPRSVFSPMKRRGHVTLDLCTSAGKIERWTIPRSFSKQAYRDARKSKWGDLWALGAKTSIPRNLRLGTSEKDLAAMTKRGEDIGKGRGRKERMKIKAMQMLEQREEERLDEIQEKREMMREIDAELNSSLLEDDFEDRRRPTSTSAPSSTKSTGTKEKKSTVPFKPFEAFKDYYSATAPLSSDLDIPNFDSPASRLQSISSSSSPSAPQSQNKRNPSNSMPDDQVDEILADWGSDFQGDGSGRSKNPNKKVRRGSAFPKFGKATKEARRVERNINRERVLRERAEMGES